MIFFYSLLHCQLFGWRCEITTWGSQTFTYLAHFSLCIQMSGIDWMFLCPFETWSDPVRGNCMPSQTPENFYSISPHRSRDSNWNWKEQQLFRCEFTFFASIKIYFLSLSLLHTFNPVKRALCDDFGNFHTIWTLELRLYYFSDTNEFTLMLTNGMFAVDSSQVREIAVCYDFFYFFIILVFFCWDDDCEWEVGLIERENSCVERGRVGWSEQRGWGGNGWLRAWHAEVVID